MTTDAKPKAGLEDVVAATSAICYLDGDRGVLAYYGYDIHDLAQGASFEEVCYLLWHGRLPNRADNGVLQREPGVVCADGDLHLLNVLPRPMCTPRPIVGTSLNGTDLQITLLASDGTTLRPLHVCKSFADGG